MHEEELKQLSDAIVALGAFRAGYVPVSKIHFERSFRRACESNACGMYGKSWMCPPHVGDIDVLIAKAKTYKWAVLYQMISPLEDSYDIEGMLEAGQRMNLLTQTVQAEMRGNYPNALHLGAGGCRLCPSCSKAENKPCKIPETAIASLEAYGICVSTMAELCQMKYINGANTVTYFGAVLLP